MGRPRKDRSESLQEYEPKIDTSEGGLATTSVPEVQVVESVPLEATGYEEAPEEMEYAEPTVDTNISADPASTPAAALLAVGRLYNEAGAVSAALSINLRKVAGEPELFSFLQRIQNALGDFRHVVEQVEQGASENLLGSIEHAVA